MFTSGIDILHALRTARQSLKPGKMHEAIENIEIFVKEGFSLSDSFKKVGVFPSMVVRMIKIGEQTSSLHKTLLYVKEYYDVTLKRQVYHLIGMIEPCMILSVGLIMAWIIYSIFLPLYATFSHLDY